MEEDPLALNHLNADAIEAAVSKGKKKAGSEIREMNARTAAMKEERMSRPSVAGPSQPPPPPPPPTPEIDRTALLDKMHAYKERFPQLKSRNKIGGKSSTEEIEDEVHYMEQQLGQRQGSMGASMLVLAMSGVEEMSKHYNPLGLNLTGLAKVTKENEDQFTPILDELVIKYGANVYAGPELRLTLALGSLVYTVHSANSGDLRMAQAMEQMNRVVKPAPSDL